MNRKGFYSIPLQGIVDKHGRFIEDLLFVFVGPPGRVYDSRMLRASPFFPKLEERMEEHKLLGDTTYIGNMYPFIVTPTRTMVH